MKRLNVIKINSVRELELLDFPENYIFHAGGTDIVVKIRAGAFSECTVIDISGISELSSITNDTFFLRIGALCTHTQIAESDIVKKFAQALSEGCSVIGAPQIRNRATIGGNLGNSSPVGDSIPPLFALDAVLLLKKGKTEREVHISEFFTGPGKNILEHGEWIREIKIPVERPVYSCFKRLGQRKALAISKLSVAFSAHITDGVAGNVKVALGAVAPTVIYADNAAAALEGIVLDKTVIKKAAHAAEKDAKPISDVRSTVEYRAKMCGTLLEEILESVL